MDSPTTPSLAPESEQQILHRIIDAIDGANLWRQIVDHCVDAGVIDERTIERCGFELSCGECDHRDHLKRRINELESGHEEALNVVEDALAIFDRNLPGARDDARHHLYTHLPRELRDLFHPETGLR